MTNYDRIKNMTVEEMAEFIQNAEENGYNDALNMPYDKCDSISEWLNSESEE